VQPLNNDFINILFGGTAFFYIYSMPVFFSGKIIIMHVSFAIYFEHVSLIKLHTGIPSVREFP